MTYKKDWARRIRERAEDLDLTYVTIAADLGVDPSTVYRWMKGQTTPSDDMKVRLALEILRCKPERLFPWPELDAA